MSSLITAQVQTEPSQITIVQEETIIRTLGSRVQEIPGDSKPTAIRFGERKDKRYKREDIEKLVNRKGQAGALEILTKGT